MSLNRLGALFSSALFLVPSVSAQGTDVVRGSFGVAVAADGVRAGGPDYSARFDARGVEFTPVLGRAAERPFPVRFTMEGVRRGANDVFVRTADVAPVAAGDQVRYVHRGDVTEVYDVRADGIEQSFVFATKPVGTGDLVVRGRITTELSLASASDDGVRYELPGTGGVTFGAVTGVDANGARARGSIRTASDGSHVEWVLPAAFVDGAAYPLVLDPLIGTAFLVDALGQADSDPAVAFDEGTSRYLVVWKVAVSSTVDEVRARLVGPTGTLLGALLVLTSTATVRGGPAVANVNTADRFLVTWAEDYVTPLFSFGSRVVMASVNAGNGVVSPAATVAAAGQGDIDSPRVGGDSRPTGVANRYACIVYRVLTPGSERLESRGVQVTAAANPVLVGVANVVTNGIVGDPSISKHAGTAGNWVVAWVHGGGASGPHQHVSCMMIGAFGVPCSAVKPVNIGVASSDVEHTSCATSDGSDFVVAWEDEVTDLVRVRPLSFTGACPGTFTSPALQSAPVDAPGDQYAPAIEFCQEKYVLTWLSDHLGSTTLFAKGLLPVTCASCGVESVVDSGPSLGAVRRPDVVSRWSGGDSASDEAVIVWADGAIRGRRFEAVGNDVVTAMGGGCSTSGFDDFATYNGDAVIGATDFDLVLANPVSLPLVLVLGFGNLSAPCGSCTIVPTLDILLPAINPYPLDLPCDPTLVSVDLYTQWVLLKPSDCPLLPDLAFSNALRFTIGE